MAMAHFTTLVFLRCGYDGIFASNFSNLVQHKLMLRRSQGSNQPPQPHKWFTEQPSLQIASWISQQHFSHYHCPGGSCLDNFTSKHPEPHAGGRNEPIGETLDTPPELVSDNFFCAAWRYPHPHTQGGVQNQESAADPFRTCEIPRYLQDG